MTRVRILSDPHGPRMYRLSPHGWEPHCPTPDPPVELVVWNGGELFSDEPAFGLGQWPIQPTLGVRGTRPSQWVHVETFGGAYVPTA